MPMQCANNDDRHLAEAATLETAREAKLAAKEQARLEEEQARMDAQRYWEQQRPVYHDHFSIP